MRILAALFFMVVTLEGLRAETLTVGDTVYALTIPYCETQEAINAVKEEAAKTGTGYAKWQELDTCHFYQNVVIVVDKPIGKFSDTHSTGGIRYIATFHIEGEQTEYYGLFVDPVVLPGIGI